MPAGTSAGNGSGSAGGGAATGTGSGSGAAGRGEVLTIAAFSMRAEPPRTSLGLSEGVTAREGRVTAQDALLLPGSVVSPFITVELRFRSRADAPRL